MIFGIQRAGPLKRLLRLRRRLRLEIFQIYRALPIAFERVARTLSYERESC
jgi:hypothetical protein